MFHSILSPVYQCDTNHYLINTGTEPHTSPPDSGLSEQHDTTPPPEVLWVVGKVCKQYTRMYILHDCMLYFPVPERRDIQPIPSVVPRLLLCIASYPGSLISMQRRSLGTTLCRGGAWVQGYADEEPRYKAMQRRSLGTRLCRGGA